MQELWQHDLSWDEKIPPELQNVWAMMFDEISALNEVNFQRCLPSAGAVGEPELITFCDAFRKAFGTCAYVRLKLFDEKFGVRFIAAKS